MQLISNSLGIFVLLVSSFIDFSISEPRVVCYYTNWSVYRPGTAKFNPQNINPYLCTHLIYSFGGFTKDNQLKPFDKYQDIEQGGYAKFTGLKTYNKELKTMLAIGGWNEGSTRFSPLVASPSRRSQLVKNSIKFLRQYKFDGLDLDWEYPAFRDGGKAKDRENYAKLVQELREEFDREHQKTGRPRLLLTMAVPAGFEYIEKGYDVPKLNKYLDWFNLLSYDYHSAYEPSVNHHAPLYPIEEENEYSFDNDLNINATIHYYLKNGADRDKLVLGIPTYGRSYTLFNPESNEIGAPADGPGEQGDATREKGYLAYYEICQSINEEESEWTVVQPNSDALGPYAYNENQWVGYDDEAIVRKKSEFVVELKLGGIMFWSIDNDDFRGLCNGKPYPLIEAAKEAYLDGLENGVHKKTQFDSNKRKQQTTSTRKPETKKSAFGKTTTPPPPTTPSTGSDFKCEDEGFFSHPSDCTKYFWCLEAPGLGIVAHHFSCPSGLVFNKAADSCDYARNVHCEKKTPKTTTISTTEATTTSTTERISYSKLSTISTVYKNLSRTTPRTTTTTSPPPRIEIDTSDLEQEDPKVIKELIELIKKAGGIEELEKQINIQEDTSSGKVDSKVTTPTSATTIDKSLVDKIRNRASLFKPRPPLFNGASQPERPTEQKTSTEKPTKSDEKEQYTPKKYNSINRFSRPQPQSAGIEEIPESDAVLIEKPQYTSILRRKPAKPEVIVENDYNNDSDRTSGEVSKTASNESEVVKKYTSISRPRRPQEQVMEETESDDEEDDDVNDEIETTVRTTASTSRSTNKYVNLSRRRSTTPAPEEKIDVSVETTTTLVQGLRTSQPLRRRTTTVETKPTEKTVLKIDTNSEIQIPRNTLDITLSKNTVTNIERDTLISNKHIHDDDDIDHIALPTESVTENISSPDSVTTTQFFNTFSPQFNANEDKVNDILNEVVDGTTEIYDFDFTTIINENIVDNNDNGLSEQNNDRFISKNVNTVPRPFTRSKLFQKTTASPLLSRNSISYSNSNINNEQTTTKIIRRRPTITRTSTTIEANKEEDFLSKPRPIYSYRPGYRGTARFRVATTRSGEYVQDSLDSKVQLFDNNRLRSLNIDRVNKRPLPSPTTTTERIVEDERTTRRRPKVTRSRITSTTTEENEETSTESRILEVKNRFSLDANERPDRIRFELSAGGKINFPEIISKKAQFENNSKVKVITGPLSKSPIEFSGREFRKGHVEEIPIQTSPETVTVQNFSDKLDLNEIPLNKSDIESFVSDSDLRTEGSIIEETTFFRKLQRPSKIGVKNRIEEGSRTAENTNENESTTRRTYFNGNRPSLKIRGRTKITETSTEEIQEKGFQKKSQYNVNQQRNRFLSRTTQRQEIDSTTARYLTKIKVSDLPIRNSLNIADSENSETQDAPEESTLRSFIETYQEDNTIDSDVLDMITEKPSDNEYENDITTLQNADYEVTENSAPETTLRTVPVKRLTVRKRPAKKIDFLAARQTITEQAKDSTSIPEFESTSSLSVTTENGDYETEIETASEKSSEKETLETTSKRPTRRVLVTRKRFNENRTSFLETKKDQENDENSEIEKQSTTPKTTRKRILTIRTKTGVIHSPVEVGIFEATEPSTEATVEEKPKIDDTDVIRKRIKVYRSRATTETVTEGSSTHKPIVTRTRVFKRPITKQTETPEINIGVEEEISTSEKPRYSQGRKVIKVTRRPIKEVATTEEEKEDQKLIESTTLTNLKTGVRKVLRIKTPRVIVDKPIEEDQLVIKTDEENQKIEQIEDKIEESIIPIENQEVASEEPSHPILKYPTRPGGKVSVTIRKRPSFIQGSRTTTIHPASTRFAKEGELNVTPTRSRIGGRRTFRPGTRNSESVVEESDQEIKPSFGKGTKKFFTKSYRKTSTTTTISPNITPHNIDIETETNDYDGVNDTTDNPEININNDILQNGKPRFTISRFTTSTTSKPTTLHHVFAIDIEEEDMNKLKNADLPENQADEVIKKLQKLIEINRIVEVYSKEDKLKVLKNKKLKSIKAGELTLERPPALDKFGEITRQVIIKLSVKPNTTASLNVSTENPNDNRSPKNIMFSETVFGKAETSTISLEGLFDLEQKEQELKGKEISTESNKKVIDLAELEQAIRNEVQERINKNDESTTESLETTTLVNDD